MHHAAAVEMENSPVNELAYELDASPRASIYSDYKPPVKQPQPAQPSPVLPQSPPPAPSIRLLFSQLAARHVILLLIPAIFSSVIAGGVAPFMTYVVGESFATFAAFPQSNPTPEDKDQLLHGVGVAAFELAALALGAFALSSITSCLWIWTGEQNVMALRQRIYDAVSQKDMTWFDTGMGSEVSEEHGSLGAAGLMAKFASETDDIRMATSLAAGQLLQYLTTCLACLLLAFIRSWSLTLVILSAVPLLMVIQTISQALAGPLVFAERTFAARAASTIDRAVTSISTVKAFNAESFEESTASQAFGAISGVGKRLNAVWGATSGLSQFTMMAMFVQGFWFGAKLIREGKVSPGNVMTVFWACLIATSNLQMCIPQLIALSKGKFAMVALLTLAGNAPSTPAKESIFKRKRDPSRNAMLQRIRPNMSTGEFSLHNVTFTHASRSTPTLSDVSLFLPAGETTFIVGASGSGKSTVAHLLLRLYKPEFGQVCLDETDVRYLDEGWMRECVVGVGQGWGVDVVMEKKTVRENVALGLEGASNAEIEEACKCALLDEFIRGLPDGYDTVLGGTGVSLSGGQRQRLAIARAWLRDPTVLVLGDFGSGPITRVTVFENLRAHRKFKTTIVITHDLSQITADDFAYVMKDGQIVEQGFRCDLEKDCGSSMSGAVRGEFRKMLDIQLGMGGFLPAKDLDAEEGPAVELQFQHEEEVEEKARDEEEREERRKTFLRPLSFGGWMLDVIADLTSLAGAAESAPQPVVEGEGPPVRRRPVSLHIELPVAPLPVVERERTERRLSLQFTPTSPVFSTFSASSEATLAEPYAREIQYDADEDEKAIMKRKTVLVDRSSTLEIKVEAHPSEQTYTPLPSFWNTLRTAYPHIPHKTFFLGLTFCLLSGAMTPLFSFLLSRLLFGVSTGAHNMSNINHIGAVVLGIAGLDGILLGLKYFTMESCALTWVTGLRNRIFSLVLKQDRAWFDKTENSAARLVQALVKDADDARNLVAVFVGQCLVVGSMLGVGLVWAMVRGWQLTLVGFAIAPVFVGVMAVQARLVAGCEGRNKRAREDVGRGFYVAVTNVRGGRAMSGLEGVFRDEFVRANEDAMSSGVKGAVVEGCTYGVASGLIYLSEALLFYAGAVLIARGTYTYLQMVEVLNLVVFTVTIGSQLMAFTQRIAKSVQATHDLNQLLKLADNTPSESTGMLRPSISGPITLNHVNFSYPERKDAPVLKNVSLTIAPGECVAIVGPSGSGKSTIAALLQRLYEPDSGSISIGSTNLADINAEHLRQHISVVSQHANLFDASVSENIKYGRAAKAVSEVDVRRAAKQANIHEFVMGLEQGYDTLIGENAALLSGGQAQRLQIARALAREGNVLILDECTSALDPENQKMVLEAVRDVVGGSERRATTTTVMVTHKVEVMRMCDRIVVVDGGEIKEEGTYEELMKRNGAFAMLTRGGEWAEE